ncbi:MAG: SUMF1/EgtB/PvdO family nonheme iron enzyme, partial [Candidatus Delongbacteria bacterium]|nr:SUMF1/EgtB/PvdO family nonheme iron enzyme [Candidatus Delongbacteria bacterium]
PGSDYKVKITSVNTSSLYDYSDTFTVSLAPDITVTNPTSSTTWQMGSSVSIQWIDNISENVKIELYKGSSAVQTISSSTASNGSYSWTVPTTLTAGTDYKVKITSVNNSSLYDYSDTFTISLAPYITVTNPTSSTTWQMGSSTSIQWNDNISENVKIELFKGSSLVQTISSSASSNGSYSWTVPTSLTSGTDYKVKITSVNSSSLYDYSDTFTISLAPYITVTNPTSSTTWQMGSSVSIQWSDNISENVKIELYKGSIAVQTLSSSTSSNGSYSWTVPTSLNAGTDYKVKITSVNTSSLYDYSDTFTISLAPYITVTNPTSSTIWQVGSSVSIQWSDNISENVKIELYKGSSAVQTISSSTSSNGSYSWTVSTSLTPGSDYKVKITSVNNSSLYDYSDTFTISLAPYITVTNPTSSTTWQIGSSVSIQWSDNINENVKIELYKGSSIVQTISSSTSSNGSYSWTVPTSLTPGSDYKVKITSVNTSSLYDYSDTFMITDLIFVQGGTFQMGDRLDEGYADEKPAHDVTLSNFFIGKYEVTQAEWQSVMTGNTNGISATPSYSTGSDKPVEQVSWYEIMVFCNRKSIQEGLTAVYSISGSTNPSTWGTAPTNNNSTWSAAICEWSANGYRLPTEAEWEYAARGGINHTDNLRFSGCHEVAELPDYAWYYPNSGHQTHDVGTRLPNQLGICDMSGNVWEWSWDWYEGYSGNSQQDPHGPNNGSHRILRGGFFYAGDLNCRVAGPRAGNPPFDRTDNLGFRLSRTE